MRRVGENVVRDACCGHVEPTSAAVFLFAVQVNGRFVDSRVLHLSLPVSSNVSMGLSSSCSFTRACVHSQSSCIPFSLQSWTTWEKIHVQNPCTKSSLNRTALAVRSPCREGHPRRSGGLSPRVGVSRRLKHLNWTFIAAVEMSCTLAWCKQMHGSFVVHGYQG